MLCPYCLKSISESVIKCSHSDCGQEIPPLYKKYYPHGLFSRKEPIIMSAVGFSGHGKTVYFASLLHVMGVELTKVWDRFFRQAIDSEGVNMVRQNLQMLERRELPEATRQNFPRPNVQRLANIPGYGDKLLVMYDTSGEAFEEDLRLERYASFVTRTKAVMFLISLIDLTEPIATEIHRLLNVYVQGMARLKAETHDQHLIVVFTKADLLLDRRFRDYEDVVRHLNNSSYVELGDIRQYRQQLHTVSNALSDFMHNTLEAREFVHLARESFKSVSYCAISSLGSAPDGNRLRESMRPVRVADPLLWVLEKG